MAFLTHTTQIPSQRMSLPIQDWISSVADHICGMMAAKPPIRMQGLDTLSEKYLRDIGLTQNDLRHYRKLELAEIARARSGNW